MAWTPGKYETNGAIIQLDGVAISTGTATVEYRRNVSGTDEYLQSDATSWSSSANTFSAPYAATRGFAHELLVPASADGYTVEFTVTHSAYGKVYSESHLVGTPASGGSSAGLEISLSPA